ncbi:MAG: beta-aspartyl-peptidase [Bacteroidetes bacterium]|nr:beta-aspartyl-peptidase [Bacteroidota bacterium]
MESNLFLIINAEVFTPEAIGKNDVLVAGGKIIAIQPQMASQVPMAKIIDANGLKLVPGFIDAHVHIAGAGGEGGPASRTPEMQLSHMIEAGVTSVVGCLGTDGFTRSFESVLMKVKALRAEGVSAWMYAGAYQVPTPTLTGDVGRDITLIEEVIGVGEIALSDHRSSHPTLAELTKLTAHARVGGMLGGKAGIINIHMGDAKNPFKLLYEVADSSELSLKQFFPTHCNRNSYIFEDAKKYGKLSYIDLTASSYPYFPDIEIKPSAAVKELLEAGVPIGHITMTSDAFGSLPHFDEQGKLVKLEMGSLKSLHSEWTDMINNEGLTIPVALKTITENPAKILKLHTKGQIKSGFDADLLLLDNNLNLRSVMANGKWMMHESKLLVKGTYE